MELKVQVVFWSLVYADFGRSYVTEEEKVEIFVQGTLETC